MLGYEIDFGTMCSRKRKRFTSSVCELAPMPKSRILSSGAGEWGLYFILFKFPFEESLVVSIWDSIRLAGYSGD